MQNMSSTGLSEMAGRAQLSNGRGGEERDMRNITPHHLRCPAGYCIGIYEVTPAEMRCGTSWSGCPAIFTEGGAYLIIGKKVETIPPELLKAAERFRCALWYAAVNPSPAPGFPAEIMKFARAHSANTHQN